MPIVKSNAGKYLAVLSDNSVDRDKEIMSNKFLQKFASDQVYIPALMDHENKVMNNVGKWVNKRIENVNGHDAFVAEPEFFKSNPNAQIIKGMIDEGAEMGVSIGAIITKSSMVKKGNDEYRQFDDGEILEASFTPVPANIRFCPEDPNFVRLPNVCDNPSLFKSLILFLNDSKVVPTVFIIGDINPKGINDCVTLLIELLKVPTLP